MFVGGFRRVRLCADTAFSGNPLGECLSPRLKRLRRNAFCVFSVDACSEIVTFFKNLQVVPRNRFILD
jgi:hypothetical protein